MALCTINGNSDMYGLGIRLGFYLQWGSYPIASLIAPSEISSIRLANTLFVTVTFLALLIQTAQQALAPIEIYIILLIIQGGSPYRIFSLLWRFIVGFNTRWDPFRVARAPPASRLFNSLYSLLLTAVCLYQLQFWITIGPRRSALSRCKNSGFLFVMVPLDSALSITVNIIITIIMMISVSAVHIVALFNLWGIADRDVAEASWEPNGPERLRIKGFQVAELIARVCSIIIVISATELTISWNNISGVRSLSFSGQLMSLMLGIAVLIRVIYKGLAQRIEREGLTATFDPRSYKSYLHFIAWCIFWTSVGFVFTLRPATNVGA